MNERRIQEINEALREMLRNVDDVVHEDAIDAFHDLHLLVHYVTMGETSEVLNSEAMRLSLVSIAPKYYVDRLIDLTFGGETHVRY